MRDFKSSRRLVQQIFLRVEMSCLYKGVWVSMGGEIGEGDGGKDSRRQRGIHLLVQIERCFAHFSPGESRSGVCGANAEFVGEHPVLLLLSGLGHAISRRGGCGEYVHSESLVHSE